MVIILQRGHALDKCNIELSMLNREQARRLRRHRSQRRGVGLERGLDRGADFRRHVPTAKAAEEFGPCGDLQEVDRAKASGEGHRQRCPGIRRVPTCGAAATVGAHFAQQYARTREAGCRIGSTPRNELCDANARVVSENGGGLGAGAATCATRRQRR
jgi:hypothetical protein